MATCTLMIIAAMMFTQAFCRPEVNRNAIEGTTKSPANLSYDDLVYILQTRRGQADQKPTTLSPCARAILGCCKETQINESCSESLNCGAYFFDDNPCDEKFVIDALNAAKSFYQQLQVPE